MNNLNERKKHKEAALKAWKTIRREKRRALVFGREPYLSQ